MMNSLTWLSLALWSVVANAAPWGSTMPPRDDNHSPGSHGKHVGGYFPSYHKDLYPVQSVEWSLFSDAYFFVTETTETSAIALDIKAHVNEQDVADFVAVAKAAGSRPILSVGGWTGSRYFSPNVATAENRTAFAKSIAEFYHKFKFEGVDVDWEYPSAQGIGCNIVSVDDTTNLIAFLQELRQMLPKAVFSMAANMLGIKEGNNTVATDLTPLAKVLDVVNIMTYDAWGGWSATTGPLAPFSDACAGDGVSVQNGVQIFLGQKFAPSQLAVGIPTYGSSFTTLSSELNETVVGGHKSLLYQQKSPVIPAGGATDDQPGVDVCGQPTAYGGHWLVSELVKDGFLSPDLSTGHNGYTRYFDDCSSTPFLFNKDKKHLISYDDIKSTTIKSQFAKSMGLKGVFFFDTAGALPEVVKAAIGAL